MGKISLLISGLLLFFFSVPLALRKVPMNKYYGFRTLAAFKSDQAWYDINAYGGRQLAWWSLVLIAAGLAGFWLPERYRGLYERSAPFFMGAVVVIAFIRVALWSRKYGS